MKYTIFVYEMIHVTKLCVMFNTYARNLTSTMDEKYSNTIKHTPRCAVFSVA